MADIQSIGELVRKAERDYKSGNTKISEHVNFSLSDTLNKIDAYLYSVHTSGSTDSLGRDKPFFNIVVAAANIWMRATDIDRQNIKVRATKEKDWYTSFFATVHLRDWMKRSRFGVYLNEWGRTLSRYGSAVTKIVQNSEGLHISVVPFSNIIFDAVDFDNNPKIEILELNMAQLRERVKTHGYDKQAVDDLEDALVSRETLEKERKDNKSEFIKLYEVHGLLPKSFLTQKDVEETENDDDDVYVQQMHVIAFVGVKKGRKIEYEDFTLIAGREKFDPYRLDSLIHEEGRSLGIGAVEYLFEAQWMVNHSQKTIKDQLDLASKLIFQTTDTNFLGNNILTDIENGDILITEPNTSISPFPNQSHDLTNWQNYASIWKSLGNEITGVSEAMLGAAPKSGTAWRQTEAMLNESYNLFEYMTENKGLAIEDMLRTRIIPYLKTKMDTKEEITTTLQAYEINRIDSRHIKNVSNRIVGKHLVNKVLAGEEISQEEVDSLTQSTQADMKNSLNEQGNQRFFKPDELDEKTWADIFSDMEWDSDVDITGEARNSREELTTLNTALQVVMNPMFESSPKAQAIVGRILENTGAMSPVEYASLPSAPVQPMQPMQGQPTPAATPPVSAGLPTNQ
jgi:hypothetical protein